MKTIETEPTFVSKADSREMIEDMIRAQERIDAMNEI